MDLCGIPCNYFGLTWISIRVATIFMKFNCRVNVLDKDRFSLTLRICKWIKYAYLIFTVLNSHISSNDRPKKLFFFQDRSSIIHRLNYWQAAWGAQSNKATSNMRGAIKHIDQQHEGRNQTQWPGAWGAQSNPVTSRMRGENKPSDQQDEGPN